MAEPFFSLMLPMRNGLPGLRRTIASLQRQTYQNFELIVQDCESTDGSLEYVRQAKLPRVDVVSERDNGVAQGYARAMRRCTGPLVIFIACDEWLDDDALETYVSWFREHPDAAFVYGGARLWKSEAEIHSLFYPGRYDLLQFLAYEMTPTQGGFFNKEVIGPDFFLDDGLKTCPDFDLMIRLGLRFDGLHIVEKRAIRFNAMVDRSSATYRTETYDQFALDRHYILERVFVQQGNCPFNDYVRRHCMSSMYAHLAAALLDIGGETPRVHRLVVESARYSPGSAAVTALVASTRGTYYDAATGQVGKRNAVQPALVPRAARQMQGVIDLSASDSPADWQAGGAAMKRDDQEVSITTGAAPWSYAAQIPLSLNDDFIHGGWYWLRLSLRVEAGQPGVSIMMPGGALKAERLIGASSSPLTVVFPFVRTALSVLVRNGGIAGQSVVRLLDAVVYGMPIPDAGNDVDLGMDRKPKALPITSTAMNARTPQGSSGVATGPVGRRNAVQPDLVPHAARPISGVIDVAKSYSEADWQAGGAATTRDDQVVSIKTGAAPWSYATLIRFNLNDNMTRDGWYWVHLSLSVNAGQVGISILMPGGSLQGEQLMSAGSSPVTLILPVVRTAVGVLFRNGGVAGQSLVTLLEATVYGMPIPAQSHDIGQHALGTNPEPRDLPADRDRQVSGDPASGWFGLWKSAIRRDRRPRQS